MDTNSDNIIMIYSITKNKDNEDLERLEKMLNLLPPTLMVDFREQHLDITRFTLKAYIYPLDGKMVHYLYIKEMHNNGEIHTCITRYCNQEELINNIVGTIVTTFQDPILILEVSKRIKSKNPDLKEKIDVKIKSVVLDFIKKEVEESSVDANQFIGIENKSIAKF